MLAKMIAARELLRADGTCVWPIIGMCPAMTLKLIRTRKAFATGKTEERTFPGVPTQMGLEVGCFAVQTLTAGYVTDVLLTPTLIRTNDGW